MELAYGVLSFNHPGITEKCVRSLPTDGPTFLCHNGSEKRFVDKLTTLFPRLNHISLGRNQGFSGGANFLLRNVFRQSKWCLFLTNDCELLSLPKDFASQVNELSPGIYAPQLFVRSTGKVDSIGGVVDLLSTRLQHLKTPHRELPRGSRFYIPGTAFLIHRDVFERLQGFDESFHTYWEDVEFCLRAQDQGWPLGTQTEIHIRHGVGKTCHGDSTYSLFHFHGNRGLFLRRTTLGFFQKTFAFVLLIFSWLQISFRLLQQKRLGDFKTLWRGIGHKLKPNNRPRFAQNLFFAGPSEWNSSA